MKQIIIYSLIASGIFCSCNKMKIAAPAFTVSTDRKTYHVGDTVSFHFSGDPDNLVFYSGETGSCYVNHNRTHEDGGQMTLTFSSAVSGGSQTDNLSLLVSTNFNGTFDATNIHNANWTDITTRAHLATSATALTSGPVNLSDLFVAGKPLYVAFKYVSPINTPTSIGRSWNITPLTINTIFPDGNKFANAADIGTGGFAGVSATGDSLKWVYTTTSMKFNTGYAGNGDEDWSISKALDISTVAPDAGVPVKNMSTGLTSIPSYVYKTAGTYTVSFVAMNGNIDDMKTIVREITLTIEP